MKINLATKPDDPDNAADILDVGGEGGCARRLRLGQRDANEGGLQSSTIVAYIFRHIEYFANYNCRIELYLN